MSYNKKDIFLSIMLMIFFISFAIVFTVFFKQLYYFDIDYLNIDITSGMPVGVIKENYDILINYQSIFYQGALNLPDFIMSTNGRIHFQEVKIIFEAIQILMVISGMISIPMVIKRLKQKEYRFFKLAGMLTIIVPSMLGFVVALDFNNAFIVFHKIVFRNDFWIFDYHSDPVIRILPETFFMHCFILIVVIVIILAGFCLIFYNYKQKQIINDTIQ
ncbi:TIGR01906 family membrane protein [Thomasclavelia sp.]